MLMYFPKLYPGELLYSWFARYHVHSGNISPKTTMKELFGTTSHIAVPDLPTNIKAVFSRLNHFEVPNIDKWIKEHTFFRYYAPFLKEKVRSEVYNAMVSEKNLGRIHLLTGIIASVIKDTPSFRFCPKCVEEDFQHYGETYWRVVHQLPSVHICLKHEYLLLKSSVSFRSKNKHMFYPASKEVCKQTQTIQKLSDKTLSQLRIIAKESELLLSQDLNFTRSGLEKAYRYLLQVKGYANVKGTIDQRKLAEQFKEFYTDEFLTLMQSEIQPNHESCWLKAITRKHRKVIHPLRHILLVRFLGEELRHFYTSSTKEYQPFGPGPYPCLNPAAEHYKQTVIPKAKITICTDTGRPVGTFQCQCGFIYSRRGPDVSAQDVYKIGRVKQFGSVWEDKLHELIHHKKESYYSAARQLKVDIATVKKYINKKQSDESELNGNKVQNPEQRRLQWLNLQRENSSLYTTELRKKAPALYTWLYRNDKDWLMNNSPKKSKPGNRKPRVNWEERDEQTLLDAIQVVINILTKEKPEPININRIGIGIGKLHRLHKQINQLPRTNAFLKDIVDSKEQFQIRRVRWAAKKLFQDNIDVTSWRIFKVAGLRNDVEQIVIDEVENQVERFSTLEGEVVSQCQLE